MPAPQDPTWENYLGAGLGAAYPMLAPSTAAANLAHKAITGQPAPGYLPQDPLTQSSLAIRSLPEEVLQAGSVPLAGPSMVLAKKLGGPDIPEMISGAFQQDIPNVIPSKLPAGALSLNTPRLTPPTTGTGTGGRVSGSGPALPGEFGKAQKVMAGATELSKTPTKALDLADWEAAESETRGQVESAGRLAETYGKAAEAMGQTYGKMLGEQAATADQLAREQEALIKAQTDIGDLEIATRYGYADKSVEELRALEDRAKQGDRSAQAYLASVQEPDPMRLFKTGPGGGMYNRIMSMIAVTLGGMGAGLTGGPNTALQVITNFLDKDVEAQLRKMQGKKDALSRLINSKNNMAERVLLLKKIGLDIGKHIVDVGEKQAATQERAEGFRQMSQAYDQLLTDNLKERARVAAGDMIKVATEEARMLTDQGQTRGAFNLEAWKAERAAASAREIPAAVAEKLGNMRALKLAVRTGKDKFSKLPMYAGLAAIDPTGASKGSIYEADRQGLVGDITKAVFGRGSDKDTARVDVRVPTPGTFRGGGEEKYDNLYVWGLDRQSSELTALRNAGYDTSNYDADFMQTVGMSPEDYLAAREKQGGIQRDWDPIQVAK